MIEIYRNYDNINNKKVELPISEKFFNKYNNKTLNEVLNTVGKTYIIVRKNKTIVYVLEGIVSNNKVYLSCEDKDFLKLTDERYKIDCIKIITNEKVYNLYSGEIDFNNEIQFKKEEEIVPPEKPEVSYRPNIHFTNYYNSEITVTAKKNNKVEKVIKVPAKAQDYEAGFPSGNIELIYSAEGYKNKIEQVNLNDNDKAFEEEEPLEYINATIVLGELINENTTGREVNFVRNLNDEQVEFYIYPTNGLTIRLTMNTGVSSVKYKLDDGNYSFKTVATIKYGSISDNFTVSADNTEVEMTFESSGGPDTGVPDTGVPEIV